MRPLQFSTIFTLLLLLNEIFSQTYSTTKGIEHPGDFKFDSVELSYKKMHGLELPLMHQDSINPLFNQCNYCQAENRRWYSSIDELCGAAAVCGYDFIQIRFDQMFINGGTGVRSDANSPNILTAMANNTALFVMIYSSVTPQSMIIDSIIYIQRNKTFSRKTVYNNPIFWKKVKTIDLSGESKQDGYSNDCQKIRELVTFGNNFCSRAEYSEKIDKFRYWFTMGDSVYCINENGFRSESMNNSTIKKNECSNVRTYYRLGIFSDIVDCFEHKRPLKQGYMKIYLKDHYIFNQCIVDYAIESENGIKSIRFDADGVIDNEIKFTGDKKLSGSIPIGFGSKRNRLIVDIIDMEGNSVEKTVEIFGRLDDEWKEHERLQNLKDAREAWSRKNGFTRVVNFAGKFEGSIISKLISIYCEGQAQKYLLMMPDNYNRDSVKVVSLPMQGRADLNNSLFQNIPTVFRYKFDLYAKDLEVSGTTVARLSNPSLNPSDDFEKLSFKYELPLGNGYYMSECSLITAGNVASKLKSSVAICSNAECVKGVLQLKGIPFIIDEPSRTIGYSLLIQCNTDRTDSLLLTYIVECLDRTRVILYRWIDCGKKTSTENGFNTIEDNETEIRFKENQKIPGVKDVTIISCEDITSRKEIVRVDVFVYSQSKNSTIGAAGIRVKY